MVFVHSELQGSQLHNPKGIQYAEDLDTFVSHSWHNSGLIWNEIVGKWKAKPSGAGSAGGDLTKTEADGYYYPSSLGKALMNFSSNKSLYANSSNVRFRFPDSSNVNIKTSGSLHKLWTWSSNKSWYAESGNVRFRFPGSSNIKSVYKPSSGRWNYASSQSISGSWMTPIYRGAGKPTAGASYEGRIIRTSGSGTNKTYVWICTRNSAGNYEWDLLALST